MIWRTLQLSLVWSALISKFSLFDDLWKDIKNALWFRWCGSYDPFRFYWSTYLSCSKWPQQRVWSKGQEELSDHLSWDDPFLLAHSDMVQLLIELNYIKVFYHIVKLQWKILCRWKASKSATVSFSSVSEVLRVCGCPCRRCMDRRQHRWVGASEDLSPHVSEHELGWNPFLWWWVSSHFKSTVIWLLLIIKAQADPLLCDTKESSGSHTRISVFSPFTSHTSYQEHMYWE